MISQLGYNDENQENFCMMPSIGYVIFFLGAVSAFAAAGDDFFETRIRPVLVTNCYACHTDSKLGGLRLDSRESVLKGGASGAAIVRARPPRVFFFRL